jgi:hypothetical protein
MLFLLSAYYPNLLSKHTNLDKNKSVISYPVGDKDNLAYFESVFDEQGNFYYNRIIEIVLADKNNGTSQLTIGEME